MSAFDAELYLRLLVEELLLGDKRRRSHDPFGSPLLDAARALVAVGAIEADAATAIDDDYSVALALRTDRQELEHASRRRRTARKRAEAAAPLAPRRLVPCAQTIELAEGTLGVRWVSLGEDATGLAVTFRPGPRRRPGSMVTRFQGGPRPYGGPPSVKLADDRGTVTGTQFSGGGGMDAWRGQFEADQPLAPDTAWIELDGHRIELDDRPSRVEIVLEELPTDDRAARHLWRMLDSASHISHGMAPDAEAAIAALVAAEAIDADDELLSDVRAVLAALNKHRGPQKAGGRPLPEPWGSLVARRGRTDGRVGEVLVAAVTPVFDGTSIAVLGLDSHESGFGIGVEVSGGVDLWLDTGVEDSRLAWWARDDRGNHYLGGVAGWSGKAGDVEFWPPIDTNATTLELIPTGPTTRCVISVLLVWETDGETDT